MRTLFHLLLLSLLLAADALTVKNVTLQQGIAYVVPLQQNDVQTVFTMPWSQGASLPGNADHICVGMQSCVKYSSPGIGYAKSRVPATGDCTCTLDDRDTCSRNGDIGCYDEGDTQTCPMLTASTCATKTDVFCFMNSGLYFQPYNVYNLGAYTNNDITSYAIISDIPKTHGSSSYLSCDYMEDLQLCPTPPTYSSSTTLLIGVSTTKTAKSFGRQSGLIRFMGALRVVVNDIEHTSLDPDQLVSQGGTVTLTVKVLATSQTALDAAVAKIKTTSTIGGYSITSVSEESSSGGSNGWIAGVVVAVLVVVAGVAGFIFYRRRQAQKQQSGDAAEYAHLADDQYRPPAPQQQQLLQTQYSYPPQRQ